MHLDPIISRLRTILSELESMQGSPDPTDEQLDIMSGVSSIPSTLEVITGPGAWPGIRVDENFKELLAIVGEGKIRTALQWAGYQRVIKLYPGNPKSEGYPWRNIIHCAQAAEPSKRWALDLEQMMRDKQRSKQSAY